MTPVTVMDQRAMFIPHSGKAKGVSLPPQLCRIGHIQAFVAAAWNIHPALMQSQARDRFASWPRQVAMYLAREITGRSFPCIGREFGRRDHTTVIYAIKAVERRMAADPLYRADVEALREGLAA